MAERVLDDDEKVVPVEPAGAAQDLSLREPGQHLGYDPELASGLEKQYDLDATRTITQTTIASTFPPETRSANPPGQKPWYKKLNPLKHGKAIPVPTERTVSREYGASLLSILTFQWMAPLMKTGYQRPLELNDIWLVNPDRAVEVLAKKLRASFQIRAARGDTYPLLWALHETFAWEFEIGGLCGMIASVVQVITPFALRYLISFTADAFLARRRGVPGPAIGHGIGLVIAISIMQIVQSMCTSHFIYRGQLVGAQARGVLITVIFEKAMRVSARAKAGGKAPEDANDQKKMDGDAPNQTGNDPKNKRSWKGLHRKKGSAATGTVKGIADHGIGWGNGRIVNLMSIDTYRIDQASGMFHLIWCSPLAIVITLVLLLVNLSYSALAGFGLLVIGLPLLTSTLRRLFVRRQAINQITDQRVTLTQEILQAIRFVKYFGWESSFLERINDLRKREVRAIKVLLTIRNAINAVSMSLPIFASMLSFITYSLSKHLLNPAPIFSSLALFNSLRIPLNLLPLIIGQVIDGWASMKRIQEFLLVEDQVEDVTWTPEGKNAVLVNHANFTWERLSIQDSAKKSLTDKKAFKREKGVPSKRNSDEGAETESTLTQAEPFRIHDTSFTVGRHELIAIIGGVGSGKSSLLAALAGDMRKTSGHVAMGGSRAFCPQYAWIQNATARENIVFGQPFDRKRYRDVIDACALKPDFDMLPNGDQTEIGERGITVSGGQKQRLNIARAIYFNSDIVLMDDPLSAVDAHVGRHIFDHAICGLLKDRCRILATHQLHVLHRCDRIIWMQDGHIETIDTFEHLMAGHEGFRKLMASTAQEEFKKEGGTETNGGEGGKRAKKRTAGPRVALMQQEERAIKSVPWSVYASYIRASGTLLNGPLVVLILILAQGSNIVTSLWLSWWTSNKWGYTEGQYIGAYAGLGLIQALLQFAFSVALSVLGTRSSKVMLQKAMTRVLRAPMSFFDTTPLGRITNRFSKDVDIMDNILQDAMRMYLFTLSMIIAVFILIIVYFHYFAIALGPLLLFFIFSAGYYRASAREVKRHEAVLRSDVFARFGEGVSGTSSIRAYGVQDQFTKGVQASVDQMNSAYYLTFSNQRWLSIRLDAIGNLLVFTTGILVVTSRFNVSPSISGLVLSYILSVVQLIQFTVRQLAEMENAMNATERIHYYGNQLEEEAPLHLAEIPSRWPPHGEIVFHEVQMRYRDGLPLVLQGLNMRIAGGERIGIVGRTGAGKSSIMSALFRLVELSGGSIRIDGVDIATVGLKDLRTRLAIIPQDPTLFRGTVRSNLDPFHEHTDLELWSALRQSDLADGDADGHADTTAHHRIHLDSVVEEEGLNFSLGQRQLMALARALVRGSQIIVCDEATSSIDMETDQKIQKTMATGFRGKTLLCIAHRLKTIINYDRICVMDQGRIAELDAPLRLWEARGIFRSMCDQGGIRRKDFEEAEMKL